MCGLKTKLEQLQSLLRGLNVTSLACKADHVFEYEHLVDAEVYEPGKPFTRPARAIACVVRAESVQCGQIRNKSSSLTTFGVV